MSGLAGEWREMAELRECTPEGKGGDAKSPVTWTFSGTITEPGKVLGEEIAAALQIPLKTVWTRLFHARKDFAAELARLELIEQRTSGLPEERRHG